MRLLIDIGNTRIKWCCIESQERIPTTLDLNAVAHHHDFSNAIKECFGRDSELLTNNTQTIQQVVVSNVAGESASNALLDFSLSQWGIKPDFVHVSRRVVGIDNHYEVLSELGVDRWVAVIGARSRILTGAVIIVNCGTAITVDVLTEDDQYLGGVILPGFQLASAALSQADGIAAISTSETEFSKNKVIGKRTKECVRLGVFAACVGGVEKVIDSIQEGVVGASASILLSGGAAPLFLDASRLDCEYDANVIMRGLNRMIECES